ncbi:hypothetical protein [Halarcobacter bivalviorum]|uniref:hypothetical protein n=1 Tax=Halarcobacter bivalviorum TaxID=663364 RepID=UPI00100A5CD3|nr:hypothetical protein [Halarcobacter bivalviorum]RXK06592.1 hypothetical protein CRU97_05060 [Halarcobacter bivalviorum]
MSLLIRPLEEQLLLAKTTTDKSLLWELHKSPYMNVRRAVARNSNIDSDIADNLIADPVLNVSYMAKLSSKATKDREFRTTLTDCVLCEKSELDLNCIECEKFNNKMIQ